MRTCTDVQSDGCCTDPEPDMKMRQAHFRYMRSKCRCSCVLQFTRHHRVSSVLHRPPSQMIHCIVLCFLILGPKVQRVCKRVNTPRREEGLGYRNPTWGDQNLFRGGSSLNCSIDIPQTRPASKVAERGTVPQTGPSRLEADSKIETSGRRRLSKRRRARAPRRQTLFRAWTSRVFLGYLRVRVGTGNR